MSPTMNSGRIDKLDELEANSEQPMEDCCIMSPRIESNTVKIDKLDELEANTHEPMEDIIVQLDQSTQDQAKMERRPSQLSVKEVLSIQATNMNDFWLHEFVQQLQICGPAASSGSGMLAWCGLEGRFLGVAVLNLFMPLVRVMFPPLGHPDAGLGEVMADVLWSTIFAMCISYCTISFVYVEKHWTNQSTGGFLMRWLMMPMIILSYNMTVLFVIHFVPLEYFNKFLLSAMLGNRINAAFVAGMVYLFIVILNDQGTKNARSSQTQKPLEEKTDLDLNRRAAQRFALGTSIFLSLFAGCLVFNLEFLSTYRVLQDFVGVILVIQKVLLFNVYRHFMGFVLFEYSPTGGIIQMCHFLLDISLFSSLSVAQCGTWIGLIGMLLIDWMRFPLLILAHTKHGQTNELAKKLVRIGGIGTFKTAFSPELSQEWIGLESMIKNATKFCGILMVLLLYPLSLGNKIVHGFLFPHAGFSMLSLVVMLVNTLVLNGGFAAFLSRRQYNFRPVINAISWKHFSYLMASSWILAIVMEFAYYSDSQV